MKLRTLRLPNYAKLAETYGEFRPMCPRYEGLWEHGYRRVRLLEDLHFITVAGVVHTARKGLVSDGASIPWILAPLAGQRMSGRHLPAAFIHDAICEQAEALGGREGLRLRQFVLCLIRPQSIFLYDSGLRYRGGH
jgi:hypothetical protein